MTDGTLLVKTPIMPVTYDVVSTPSHRNAKMMEFLPESLSEFKDDSAMLYEGLDLSLLEAEDIYISDSNKCVEEFMEQIIQEKFSRFIKGNIRFRI
jgi:hypothetical protein